MVYSAPGAPSVSCHPNGELTPSPEGSASRDTGGNLPEVDRGGEDVHPEPGAGRDAQEQGE